MSESISNTNNDKNADIFVEVAIKVPLHRTFDYRVDNPSEFENLRPGMRVKVPFANRTQVAVILAIKHSSDVPAAKIKAIKSVIDAQPIIDSRYLKLIRFCANYYHYPVGETLFTALPKALRVGDPIDKASINVLSLTDKGEKKPTLRSKKQQALLSQISEMGPSPVTEVKALGYSKATIDALVEKSLAKIDLVFDDQWRFRPLETGKKPQLNSEQAVACSAINQSQGYQCFAIEGVTGSGKTEVYLQCLEEVIKQGKQALVLVPEIGLTPQTINRFRRRFPNIPIMLWHSALTDTERLQAWRFCQKGSCAIVIGTRSAIFMPFEQLGMIIVDEEHDSSFKQQDTLRYHARDLAAFRAHEQNIPLVLGSATLALETLNKALQSKYQLLTLTQRAQTTTDNQFQLIDIKGQHLEAGLSHSSLAFIEQQLQRQKQVMIFLNRRGFSPSLICHECGWLSECHRCSTSATYHKSMRQLVCHHCGETCAPPMQCPDCGSTQINHVGTGTEQLEEVLKERFADTPISRIDRDSTRKKGSLEAELTRINEGGRRILIGTQMLAKGHHFADVSLVVIVDVDGGLHSCDFRATEHLAQLVTQVAGRAGRSGEPGTVLLQTHFPEHPLLQDLVNNGYTDFARYALSERQDADLPPYTHLAILRAESHDLAVLLAFLSDLIPATPLPDIQLLGPIPAPLERIAGKFRYQLHIQANERAALHHFLQQLTDYLGRSKLATKVRWSLDVDPIDMM